MKKIPKRNYIIYLFIVLITIGLVFGLKRWYEMKKDAENIKRMNGISEIKEEELNNYLIENQNIILYLASSKEKELEEFENKFIEHINNENLTRKITYIDLSEVKSNFNIKLREEIRLNNNIELENKVTFIIIEEGNVIDILQKEDEEITIEEVQKFLEGHVQ